MSKYCAGSFVYPDPFKEEKAFIQVLKDKIKELRPKVLMPTHDESVVIMRHRDELPEELIIPYENSDKLLLLANKAKSTELARKAGVAVPKIYQSVDDVTNYPVVFKTVIGNSAKGVFFPRIKKNFLDLWKSISMKKLFCKNGLAERTIVWIVYVGMVSARCLFIMHL